MADEEFPQELLAEDPRDPEVEKLIDQWCEYYVDTENFDRNGVHYNFKRMGHAMPAPWRMRDSQAYAKVQRDKLHKSQTEEGWTPESINGVRKFASDMTHEEQALRCGMRLLPLNDASEGS